MRRSKLGILEVLDSKWFIQPEAAQAYLPLVVQMVQNPMAMSREEEDDTLVRDYTSFSASLYGISDYGNAVSPEGAPKGSVAVIAFDGVISRSDQGCGDAGTETKANILSRCFANPNIIGVALHISSPGGAGNAIQALRTAMEEKNKPVVAYIDEMAASAGYWIASLADEIVVKNERVEVGSIGAYVTLANWDGYYEKLGLKVQRIYSSFSTEKNKAVEEALKGNTELLVADIDKFTNFFFEDVKAGRPALQAPKDDKIFKGAMYYGDEAVENGMADYMGGWDVVEDRVNALKANYQTIFTI